MPCRGSVPAAHEHAFGPQCLRQLLFDRCGLSSWHLLQMHRRTGEDFEAPPQHTASRPNARLVLILANHIGDRNVLDEAIVLARTDLAPVTLPPEE